MVQLLAAEREYPGLVVAPGGGVDGDGNWLQIQSLLQRIAVVGGDSGIPRDRVGTRVLKGRVAGACHSGTGCVRVVRVRVQRVLLHILERLHHQTAIAPLVPE